DPEVRQRMIVQGYAATEPAVDVVTVAEPVQRPCAANAIARGVKPKRQQQPRRRWWMAGRVFPRLDPILQCAQVELLDIGPDHPRRMILPDQAIDIDRSQLDLIAHRFAQPGGAPRHYLGSWRGLFRQFPTQLVVSHHSLRQPICLENHIRVSRGMKKSHSLVGWAKRKRAHRRSRHLRIDGGHGAMRLCPPYRTGAESGYGAIKARF